ncbi:MAG: GEVED domain-containing protein, partial [Granulicatella sp.]
MRNKRKKSFNWYGLRQRFSIRKYHFGAASVLIGTALVFAGGQTAQANEQVSSETASALVKDKTEGNGTVGKTESNQNTIVEKPVSKEAAATTAATTPTVESTSVKPEATTTENSTPVVEKTEVVAPKTAEEVVEKTTETPKEKVEEKAKEDDKKDSKEDSGKQETVKEVEKAKEDLEKAVNEAKALNSSALSYAEKSVKDEKAKDALIQAIENAKKAIEKANELKKSKTVTAEELNKQRSAVNNALEAVYTAMKAAGHDGKVSAVLADATANAPISILNPINKVVVNNFGAITDEEARAIEKEIRTANPTLTPEDKIEITTTGASSRVVAKITLANGKVDQFGSATHDFLIGDVAFGTAGQKNFDQLREAINWFDFARSAITYSDGTKVSAVEYVDNPPRVTFTSSKGRQEEGRFTMVRTVLESTTHPELVGKKTNDPAFLASGIAKYTLWKDYNNIKKEVEENKSEGRNQNEIYEALQEGMRFDVPTKVKGYTLSATVSSLSRKKVDNEALTLNKANGEPENINRNTIRGQVQREDVILTTQDRQYSHLRVAGFETTYVDSKGVKREGLTAFAPAYDGGNIGVKFELSATYNGRPVAVNAIAADAEDLTANEFTQFETDGTPWEEFMRLNKNQTDSKGLEPLTPIGDFYNGTDRTTPKGGPKYSLGYNENEWKNKTETGYGSQFFGPFNSGIQTGKDLPIGLSQNVEHLGVYVNAAGSQSASVGFVIYDGGDAPASYGSAQHIIGNFNKTVNGVQKVATQPYLGEVPADTDFRTTVNEPNGAWVLDDLVNSEDYKEISLISGSTKVTNSKGQSGTYVLDGKNPVIRMQDGTQVAIKNGEILSTANTLKGGDGNPIKGLYNQATRGLGIGNLPDEGENQLLDPAVATKYTLRHASENEYVLKGVRVNRGVNNDVAYVRGWVDFNGNGKFDLYESSELVTANADGTYDITFKNTPQLLNTSVDNLGVRLRISVDQNDLRLPTGLASSGEVEDFVANVIHQPRGTRHKTKGFQGAKQEVNFPTNAMFTASGKTIESNYRNWAQIDNNTAPKMVINDTVVKSEEPTGKTVEVKDKLSQTIYKGIEVVVKDAKGNTLGTAVKVTNKLTGKVEYYLSEYTEYDTAGNKVGVYKLNEGTEENKNSKEGSLNFTKITFQPEPGFVGTAKGVAIRAWDDNGSHTGWEATEDTIKESLTSTTLAEKDKVLENVNNGNNGVKSMDTSYIPTVIDVRPVGEDTTTEDVQGKPQTSNPTIPAYGSVETVTNDKVEDVKYTADHVILDKTKKPTFATKKETPGKLYPVDTKVDKETTVTLLDGTTVTYKPSDKIPAGTKIANTGDVTVTGTGNVVVNNIRLVKGTLIPAGAKPQSNHPAPVEVKVTLANGTEQTIPAG